MSRLDFTNIFSHYDFSALNQFYYVFMFLYNKLRDDFPSELAASIASDLASAFLENFDLDPNV